MTPAPEDRDEVAEAARVLSALGLVTAYGHVSARTGTAMLITPAADLATVTGSTLVEVPLTAGAAAWRSRRGVGAPGSLPGQERCWSDRPRPAPGRVRRGRRAEALLPLHGQAAWLGASVPVHDSALLLRSAELAGAAAGRLPEGEALLLRGNGALTLGPRQASRSPACGCSRPPATRSSPPGRAVR